MNTDKNKTEKLKEQLNKLLKTCNECRGNFNDDCRDCPTLNKRCSIYSELEKLKDKNMPVIVGEDTYFSAEDARRVSDEQRCSIDNVELDKVYVDYLKTPQHIRLTQEQIDLTEDTS